MKKILTASVAILCCTMTMMAEPVSPETARQSAAKFLNKKGIALKSEAMQKGVYIHNGRKMVIK